MILWTIICFIGFNLIVNGKGGNLENFLYTTIVSFIVGPTIGFLVFKQNKKRLHSK